MTLGEQVLEFEKEVSDVDCVNEEKENILKLTTLEEVENYYMDDRGWRGDDDFVDTLIHLLSTLEE